MSGYEITLSGCETVLNSMLVEADELSTALGGIEGIVTSAVTNSGECPVIAEAIGVFFENRATTLQGIGTRMEAAMTGTVAAIGWYNKGDEEMMLTQQQLASEVASTGRFDQFTEAPE